MPYGLLIVDDDREFRDEFKECFDEYKVYEAGTGKQAMELLAKPNEVDLVFLDVNLPDTKGTTLLTTIHDLYPKLGIVILTGHGSKDVVLEALKGKADDYVDKPIDIDRTKDLIKKLLESKVEAIDVVNGSLEDKLQRVKHYADRNVYKKVVLEDVARLVFLSPKYLSRLFKQHTGMNFSEYRLKVKIKEAMKLLKQKGMSVEQIAFNMGYQNLESFIRIFKKITGKTPSEFRKSEP
ncbi:MAG: helix-turn-helix domain-containing protein [Candidatus Margulisbacteria bacterium]|nr:helix-turn-helix domain-containing protein [Candidatus Margulisiibacteriota bacterium]